MTRIQLYTGKKQSGKSTSLWKRYHTQKETGGLIMKVINNQRYFYSLSQNNSWLASAGIDEREVLKVGKFTFSKSAFEKANNWIINDLQNFSTLVLDEIGPLEMRQQKGLWPALQECLKSPKPIDLILVVRLSMYQELEDYLKEFCYPISIEMH